MFVVKRNGNKEEFNSSKVKNAIRSAFKALDYDVEESVLDNITKDVEIWDNINVEDIQDEIKACLNTIVENIMQLQKNI